MRSENLLLYCSLFSFADIDFCLQQNNLTFTMENAAMSQCRRFQTKSDTALEDTEKFYVRLLSSDSSVVIKNAKASIDIIDTNNGNSTSSDVH